MLSRLDEINWRELRTASGTADSIPTMIRKLTEPDETIRENAYVQLQEYLSQQGSSYQSTAYAVPFLIELLGYENVPDKVRLLELLQMIAGNHPYDEVTEYWQTRSLEAVRSGIPTYRVLLNHIDSSIRIMAARLLSQLKQDVVSTAPWLISQIELEFEQVVKASILSSLGELITDNPDTPYEISRQYRQFVQDFLDSFTNVLAKFIVAESEINYAKEQASAKSLTALREIIEQHPELYWEEGGLSTVCSTLLKTGAVLGVPILVGMLQLVGKPEEAEIVINTLLALTFNRKRLKDLVTSMEFSEIQLTVLRGILESDVFWRAASSRTLLENYGLPSSREKFVQLVSQ